MKNTPSKKPLIDDYCHPSQIEKNWKVTNAQGQVQVGFPVGLYEIVPVAWSVSDFINSDYCNLPNMSITNEGQRVTHQINANDSEGTGEFDEDGDEILKFAPPRIVEFKNEGMQVSVEAEDEQTARRYSRLLRGAVIREKYRTLEYLERYEQSLKCGRMRWQFYRRKDDYTVMILPKKAKQYLKLKDGKGMVIKPLSYELEGFVALHADFKELAKQQAERILRWLYKIPKPAKKTRTCKQNKRRVTQ